MPLKSKSFPSLDELILEYVQRKWEISREKRMKELRQLYKFRAPWFVEDYSEPLPGLADWLSAGERKWLLMCWEERTCL
jgi:hypothetical protein